MKPFFVVPLVACLCVSTSQLSAADQPQWGQRYTRNLVSDEKGLPETFDPGRRDNQTGQIELAPQSGVRWVVALGNQAYGTPIVAGGRVFVGTNNGNPRDQRIEGDRGVLMCFDEKSGDFLWQLNVPKLVEVKYGDWHYVGICSPPVVEGDRAYLVTNRCEVMCLDVNGLADGNQGPFTDEGHHMVAQGETPLVPTDRHADIVWLYDMVGQLGVEPHNASNCSILVHGNLLYICTSNGVDWTHTYVTNPKAPSLIVVDKRTGKLVARDDFGIGADVTHGQWSSPVLGEVDGRALIYFGAGNGIMYAFEPVTEQAAAKQAADGEPLKLKPVWWFNGHPLAQTQAHVPPDHQHDSTSYEVTANPVFDNGHLYATFTQEPFHGMKHGWLVCLKGDGPADGRFNGDVTRRNLVWSYADIGCSVSTVAVADGLVYAAGFDGRLHCLEADTGRIVWIHDAEGRISASPLLADGKIYLGTQRQTLWVLAAGRELKVLNRIRLRDAISCTPTAANGTLFVATRRHLYAVGD